MRRKARSLAGVVVVGLMLASPGSAGAADRSELRLLIPHVGLDVVTVGLESSVWHLNAHALSRIPLVGALAADDFALPTAQHQEHLRVLGTASIARSGLTLASTVHIASAPDGALRARLAIWSTVIGSWEAGIAVFAWIWTADYRRKLTGVAAEGSPWWRAAVAASREHDAAGAMTMLFASFRFALSIVTHHAPEPARRGDVVIRVVPAAGGLALVGQF